MDELINETMVCSRELANLVKRADFNDQEKEVIRQSVLNGQIIVQGLHGLKSNFEQEQMKPEDEFFAAYFTEQAQQFLAQTKRFIAQLNAVNHV